MAFQVYPDAPLSVASGATTYTTFTQLTGASVPAGSYNKMMFIRVSMFGGTTPPNLYVTANTGDPVQALTLAQQGPKPVYNLPGMSPSAYVGDVQLITAGEASNVYQVQVGFFADTTESWQLGIQNNDGVNRKFTWVVADSIAGTAQPWIDVEPATLPLDALIGETVTDSVQVANYGTAAFTVTALNPTLPANLTVDNTTPLPLTVSPGMSATLKVTFTAPTTSGPTTAMSALTINPADAAAGTTGHNQQLTVNALAQQLEVVLLLDDSGSMSWDQYGHTPTGSLKSRWSELTSATDTFLNDLAHFGNGHGNFGIARFPAGNPSDTSTFNIVTPGPIPAKNSKPLADAEGDVAAITPLDNTPMGDGMHHVMDTATSYFATDQNSIDNNLRWLILMSDGAQNQGSSPTDFTTPTDFLTENKIALFAIGYGIQGYSNVDLPMLQSLASASYGGGGFYAVDMPNTTGQTLETALLNVIKNVLTATASPRDPSAVFLYGQQENRHDVLLTPYDGKTAFSLFWDTPDATRLELTLLSPTCEEITPQNAGQGALSQVTFCGGNRYQSYYFESDFLANPGGQPRYGTWTMVVTVPLELQAVPADRAAAADAAGVYEYYSYGVTAESSLRMRLTLDQSAYYAGDPVGVSARLTAAGLPVTGASVVLSTTSPAQSLANWLAGLTVPAAAMAQATKQLQGQDATPILVKALAAQIAGLQFDPAAQQGNLVMTDPRGIGTYQATYADTTVPEQRTLYVTAIGETPDGTAFRREGKLQVFVLVRPDPVATILTLHFGAGGTAIATVFPLDKFGNVLFTEPRSAGSLQLVASGAEFTGPMVNNLDGSYSRPLRITGPSPAVGVQFDGQDVVPARPVPPLADLHYVDEVIRFDGGLFASANQHSDPRTVLGSIDGKPAGTFVSLGAGGQLIVGFHEQVIEADDGGGDVTVFIQPDDDLRAYRLEAYSTEDGHDGNGHDGNGHGDPGHGDPGHGDPGHGDQGHGDQGHWVSLGESIGVTQSFSLRAAGLDYTPALRITDTSGRARGADLNPLTTPGVSVLGVGVLKTGTDLPFGLGNLADWLSELWHQLT